MSSYIYACEQLNEQWNRVSIYGHIHIDIITIFSLIESVRKFESYYIYYNSPWKLKLEIQI